MILCISIAPKLSWLMFHTTRAFLYEHLSLFFSFFLLYSPFSVYTRLSHRVILSLSLSCNISVFTPFIFYYSHSLCLLIFLFCLFSPCLSVNLFLTLILVLLIFFILVLSFTTLYHSWSLYDTTCFDLI